MCILKYTDMCLPMIKMCFKVLDNLRFIFLIIVSFIEHLYVHLDCCIKNLCIGAKYSQPLQSFMCNLDSSIKLICFENLL